MRASLVIFSMSLAAMPAAAQRGRLGTERQLSCDDRGFNQNRLVTHCEMREQTVGFAGRLSIDAGTNGGVTVKGADRADVLVRAKVEAAAEDLPAAKALASQITLNVSAGQIAAVGPEQDKRQSWSVSYEIFVPRQADLGVKAHNGGIAIAEIRGRIEFETMNGGVSLKRLAGDVEGHTMNGGLSIELAGDRWDGAKLDARTMNGGINMTVPERYSAHLETSTVNGNLNIDFPMTVRGELGRRLSTDLGSGGSLIHVETTNGGVNLKRSAI